MKIEWHYKLGALACLICFSAFGYAIYTNPRYVEKEQCHTFASTGTSHIRMNNCTGDAHIIVRGPNGFEWQRVIE